jgi:hypothetical protein
MKRAMTLFTVLGLALAACGGDDATETTIPTTGPTSTAGDSPQNVSNSDVLLTITSEGGFVPVEFNLDRMPRYVLLADGTLFYQGPVPAIFPGPLLPNVQVTEVTATQMDEILQLVEEMGLPEIDEFIDDSNAEMVADATTEFITYYDDNGTHRLGIYALGITEGGGSTERILANELIEVLEEATATGESRPYAADRLQAAAGPALGFEEVEGRVEPWPLEVDFSEMPEWAIGWRCVEIEGAEVGELLEVFADTNQATRWNTGDDELTIKARPLLPGEDACGGAPQGG